MIRKDIKFFTCSQVYSYTFVNRENTATDCNTMICKGVFFISIIYYLSIISTQPFTSLHTVAMGPKGDPDPTESFQPPGVLGKIYSTGNIEAEGEQSTARKVICMGLYYGWCRWNGTPTSNFFLSGGGGLGFLSFRSGSGVSRDPQRSPRGKRTNTRTNLYKGENKEEGTGEGTDIALFTRLTRFYGVFFLG